LKKIALYSNRNLQKEIDISDLQNYLELEPTQFFSIHQFIRSQWFETSGFKTLKGPQLLYVAAPYSFTGGASPVIRSNLPFVCAHHFA